MSADPLVFHNPILKGFNPDPTICVVPATPDGRHPTTYFLSTSTFEYFPGCAIYTSTDLLRWRLIGHALTRRSQVEMRTVEPGAGSWASTLRYRAEEGRWYLANCLFQRYRPGSDERIFPRGFYVYTDNIWDEKAWSDPVYFDNPGFDQDLFWDDDGKVYLSTTMRLARRPPNSTQKDFAIHISEIHLPTGRTLTAPAVIRSSPHGIAEGSHIIRRGGWYYLFTAEGGTEAGHQEWVFRSKDGVYGPWEEQGRPLWYNGPDEVVQRTGHADVFEDGEGRWWAVLLGVRPLRVEDDEGGGRWLEPQLGKETFLVKVDWVDDWPVFNEGKNITLLTRGRENVAKPKIDEVLSEQKEENPVWTADLSKPELELGWYQKNTPLKQSYSLNDRPGHLRLHGNCHDLSSPEAPTMLLRKQTAYTQTFQATMGFSPSKLGYEAGVVLWWSQFSYATVGVTLVELPDGEKVQTIVRRSPGGRAGVIHVSSLVSDESGKKLLSQETFTLSVCCEHEKYTLGIRQGPEEDYGTCRADALTVMPPVGGAFTGVLFGLYSFGRGEPVLDPADFAEIRVSEHARE
ncbi:family 43 glycoside hydrolase [Cryphonectria parasitica EP155]|uniref:Family 43 glycoside hydrolase n=1 Tax=Cryphonectria parasitica (strain ATCC 38755 / EP155) TaxID=660469 RepID=A0A9P4XX78_CRYP1|nr:family 43 glycoside hydrolase [Cryphonectria parasitica EP155]KAF3762225.1 family 43 glycoside hydrolase [Cryphonectria parasitica EP155]